MSQSGRTGRDRLLVVALSALAIFSGMAAAQPLGQPENPVFVNDSPASVDALARIEEHRASGNNAEAIRLLQRLLDDQAGSLVPSADDPALFVTVRERVHAVLLGDAGFLERYRREQAAPAEAMLARGEIAELERSRLLTASGLTAALRVSRELLEGSHFEAAALTLAQLDMHPDRATNPDAVALAGLIARYAPASGVAGLWQRWSREGGGAGGAEVAVGVPELVTGPVRPMVLSPGSNQPQADLTGLVPRALGSVLFGDLEESENIRNIAANSGVENIPRYGRQLRTWPVVQGDAIYLASGTHVMALDRLTLRELWRTDLRQLLGLGPEPEDEERGINRFGGSQWQEVRAPVVRGEFVIVPFFATSSNSNNNNNIINTNDGGQELILALDGVTGALRWSVVVAELDPQLAQARVRGRMLIEGDRLILGLRKDIGQRRLSALYLAGLDLADGSLSWLNLLGSVGTLPFLRQAQVSDDPALFEGVVYRSDRVGLVGAYIAATGRPLWVRRLRSEAPDSPSASGPWQFGGAVVADRRLLLLSSDRRELLVLDRSSGAVLGRRSADLLDNPSYLLVTGNKLAAVGERRIAFTDLADPTGAPVNITPLFSGGGIRGRVVVAGTRLLVPVVGGVALVDPEAPTEPAAITPVDDSGNIVLDRGQLLTVDDARLHSYLAWEQADRLLTERIGKQPGEPAAGIALAELAYRAGRPGRILFGVDAAQKALANLPPESRTDRDRLVAALRLMIAGAQREEGDRRPPASSAFEMPMLGELIGRLGDLVQAAPDRAAHWMHLGFHQLALGDAAAAVASYQQILEKPELGPTLWRGDQLGLRADAEATRRLERLVQQHGRSAYAVFDATAERAVAALASDTTVEDLEALARWYPVARVAPALWGRVARAYELADKPRAAARALEVGLQVAEKLPDPPDAETAELAGRLLTNLKDRALLTAAEDSLRRVRERFPQLALTLGGVPLDLQRFSTDLAERRANTERWPRVGLPTGEGVQVLAGWSIMDPVIPPIRPAVSKVLVVHHVDGRLGIFAASAGGEAAPPALELRWTSPAGEKTAELLRVDRETVFFYHVTEAGALIERVDALAGTSTWRSKPFAKHFDAGTKALIPGQVRVNAERIRTPTEGMRDPSELLACGDDRTFALVERGGRAVGIDADSGASLWSAALPLRAVFDCDLTGDLLTVIGDGEVRGPGGEPIAIAPRVLILNARTGQLLHQVDTELGQLRWLRLSTRGDLVVGAQNGLMGIDPESGNVIWKNTQVPASAAVRAWIHGGAVLLVSNDQTIWPLSLATGEIASAPIEVAVRLDSAAATLTYISGNNLALASPQGLILLAENGSVQGADALGATDNLLAPQPATGAFFTMETGSTTTTKGATAFALHRLDATNARLTVTINLGLPDSPKAMSLLDSRIAISAGADTIVYWAAP